jgi:hypothetical protein
MADLENEIIGGRGCGFLFFFLFSHTLFLLLSSHFSIPNGFLPRAALFRLGVFTFD